MFKVKQKNRYINLDDAICSDCNWFIDSEKDCLFLVPDKNSVTVFKEGMVIIFDTQELNMPSELDRLAFEMGFDDGESMALENFLIPVKAVNAEIVI